MAEYGPVFEIAQLSPISEPTMNAITCWTKRLVSYRLFQVKNKRTDSETPWLAESLLLDRSPDSNYRSKIIDIIDFLHDHMNNKQYHGQAQSRTWQKKKEKGPSTSPVKEHQKLIPRNVCGYAMKFIPASTGSPKHQHRIINCSTLAK